MAVNIVNPYHPMSIISGNSLGQGLVCAVFANEGAGQLTELVTNTPLPLTGSGARKAFNFGWGLDCSVANNSGAQGSVPGSSVILGSPGSFSIYCRIAFTGSTPTLSAPIFGLIDTAGSYGNQADEALISVSNGGGSLTTAIGWVLGNGNFSQYTSSVGINTTPRDVLLTCNGAFGVSLDVRMYENGVFIGNSSPTNSINITSSAKLVVGQQSGYSANSQVWFSHGMIWNRALTAAEALQLNANPYQMFQTRRRKFVGIGSGGSSIKFRRSLSQYGTGAGKRQSIGV